MLLKQEKPEMDDFVRKKIIGSEGKILWKLSQVFYGHLCKNV